MCDSTFFWIYVSIAPLKVMELLPSIPSFANWQLNYRYNSTNRTNPLLKRIELVLNRTLNWNSLLTNEPRAGVTLLPAQQLTLTLLCCLKTYLSYGV